MDEYYMKTYKRDAGVLVAVCDEALVGKTLNEGGLDVNVSTHFYQGKLVRAEAVMKALSAAFAGNFFGEKAVKLAIMSGLVEKSAVKKIAGVPHAQFIRMSI